MDYPSEIKVGKKTFGIDYKRAKGSSSSVRLKGGCVILTLNPRLRGRELDRTLDKFLSWAKKKIAKLGDTQFISPIYKDGATIWTHNKVYELVVNYHDKANARSVLREDGVIELWMRLDDDRIQQLAEQVIIKDRTPYLKSVVDELNQLHFQADYGLVRFKRVSSRFGSCSIKGNINIAFRLLFAPREVFRYVCVHELAHLKEFNHSKRFWAIVEEAMPDYKSSEKWLRENGFALG